MLADGQDFCEYTNVCLDPPSPFSPSTRVHFIMSTDDALTVSVATKLSPHVFALKRKWRNSIKSLRELAKALYLRVARINMPATHRGPLVEEFDLTYKDLSQPDAPFSQRLVPKLMDEARLTVGFIKPTRAVPARFGGEFKGAVVWVDSLYVSPTFWLQNGHLWGTPASLVHPLLGVSTANSSLRLGLPPLNNLLVLGHRMGGRAIQEHASPLAGPRKRYVSALFHSAMPYIVQGEEPLQGFKASKRNMAGAFDGLPDPVTGEIRSYRQLLLKKPFGGTRLIFSAGDLPPQPPTTGYFKEPVRLCAQRAVVLGHSPSFLGGALGDVLWTRLAARALRAPHLGAPARHHHRMGTAGAANSGKAAANTQSRSAASASGTGKRRRRRRRSKARSTASNSTAVLGGAQPWRVLVLDRKGSDASRRLLDPQGVLGVLHRYGCEPTFVSDDELTAMPFAAQAGLWARHRVAVAVHGAALYGASFMSRGSVLVELVPFGVYKPGYAKLAAQAGLVHLPVFSHVKGPDLRYEKHFGPGKTPAEIAASCDALGYVSLTRTSCFHLFRDGAVVVPLARFESAIVAALNLVGTARVYPRASVADALDGVAQSGEHREADSEDSDMQVLSRKQSFCKANCAFASMRTGNMYS